jgi:hypothetical protein
MPSLEGKIRHLKKYDRNDEPPDSMVREAFAKTLDFFPQAEPDDAYLLDCSRSSHVEAFGTRWDHVKWKGAGVEGERLYKKPVKKQHFLDHPNAEAILQDAMGDALVGGFQPQPMRAAGRAKVILQEKLLESFDKPSGATIDRLIWISPPTSLHVSTPGAKTMSKRLHQASVSSYGLSPFRGGAQEVFERFGYCGSRLPIGVRKTISDPVIGSEERRLYVQALKKHRPYFVQKMFGMGSDVERMDSSMRRWWIETWANPAYKDFTSLDDDEKLHMTKALVDCHCGGRLAMEADIMAEVPEGASTGAIGVSTLESTYRWIGDLLGVALNLQWEVVRHMRRLARSGQAVPDCVVNLAGLDDLDFLRSERVAVRPENRTEALSGDAEERLRRRVLASKVGSGRRSPRLAFWPAMGPGTPLFEKLVPIAAFYHNCLVNGDDDWNTFPLLEMVPKDQIFNILTTGGRCQLLRDNVPKKSSLPRLVIGTKSMTKAFESLRLPTRLSAEKGIEGRGIRSFLFNSMKPVWSAFDGAFSFAIHGASPSSDFESFSHPDDKVKSPTHSALRLVGLSLLSPDPRHYQLSKCLFDQIVKNGNIPIINNKMDISAHLAKEAQKSLYNVLSKMAPDTQLKIDLKSGWTRFPTYSEVLTLHGFHRSACFLDGIEDFDPQKLIEVGFPKDPAW